MRKRKRLVFYYYYYYYLLAPACAIVGWRLVLRECLGASFQDSERCFIAWESWTGCFSFPAGGSFSTCPWIMGNYSSSCILGMDGRLHVNRVLISRLPPRPKGGLEKGDSEPQMVPRVPVCESGFSDVNNNLGHLRFIYCIITISAAGQRVDSLDHAVIHHN